MEGLRGLSFAQMLAFRHRIACNHRRLFQRTHAPGYSCARALFWPGNGSTEALQLCALGLQRALSVLLCPEGSDYYKVSKSAVCLRACVPLVEIVTLITTHPPLCIELHSRKRLAALFDDEAGNYTTWGVLVLGFLRLMWYSLY